MLPENLVLDESATPEDFDSLLELLDTRFKTEHEQTSLEHLSLSPDGIVRTASGELHVTRDFLEQCAKAIRMPLAYAYTVVGIDQHERAEMQEQIRARGPQSQPVVTRWNVYDTHNRITHAAHGQGLRTRRALQEIGGDLLFRASRWQMASSMN